MKLTIEEKLRKGLALTRFFQKIVSPSFSNSLLKEAVKRLQFTEGTSRESILANGVPCEWIMPQDISTKGILIYIHGGGFVFGLTPNHLQMVAALAREMKIKTLMVDYRLAPKYPFPAALEDCVSVYKWVLAQDISPESIVIAGDSAGGNLAITSLIRLRELDISMPSAIACLSPVVNLMPDANQRAGYKDLLLPSKAINFYNAAYVGNNNAKNPLISPIFGDLADLPPILVHIGEDEILRDNAVSFSMLAKEAGVNITYKIYARMWHVWQLYLNLPQSTQSLGEIKDFLISHLIQ
jgi:acetyl esterase/lipase